MGREFRILSGLRTTAVPVPEPLAFCDDAEVNGAPFYVMEFVDGAILRDEAEAERTSPRRTGAGWPTRSCARWASCTRSTRRRPVWAPSAARTATSGPPAAALAASMGAGSAVPRGSRRSTRSTGGSPAIPEPQRLSRSSTATTASTTWSSPRRTARAVLDWELCTLGDPLADVGLLAVYWVPPGGRRVSSLLSGTRRAARRRLPRPRNELLGAYARHTGADLSAIGFYIALAYWKLACIAEGIYARYSGGRDGRRRRAAGAAGRPGPEAGRGRAAHHRARG